MKNIYLIGILILALIPLMPAETYPQNSDVIISHPVRINGAVNPSTNVNVSIRDPLGNFLILAQNMSFNSSTLENQYFLDGGNTSKVGIYPYCITASGSGLNTTECFSDLEITPSGFSRINAGEGLIVFSGLGIMFIIGVLSLILFFKSESFAGKVTFLCVSVIFMLISILFGAVLFQQNLAGFGNVLTGYDTFLFVVKSGVTVLAVAFGIFLFLFFIKAWRIRTGRYEN